MNKFGNYFIWRKIIYYKATTEKDFDYIVNLFNPNNTEFMNSRLITRESLLFPGRNDYNLLKNEKKSAGSISGTPANLA